MGVWLCGRLCSYTNHMADRGLCSDTSSVADRGLCSDKRRLLDRGLCSDTRHMADKSLCSDTNLYDMSLYALSIQNPVKYRQCHIYCYSMSFTDTLSQRDDLSLRPAPCPVLSCFLPCAPLCSFTMLCSLPALSQCRQGHIYCYTMNPSDTWAPAICALRVCTLFMIFFWCPTSITPKVVKSLTVICDTWSMLVNPTCRKWSEYLSILILVSHSSTLSYLTKSGVLESRYGNGLQ